MSSQSSSECCTHKSFAPLFLRLALGIMIFAHGAQKLLGWFGGYGYTGTMGYFTSNLHIPWVLAFAAILIEFFGGIALILGLFTRVAAFLVGLELIVAAFMIHVGNGFFMNWSGQQKGEGYEFFILVAGIAIALILKGGGALSLDSALCCRNKAPEAPKA
jgi:putative oxidoreductase